MDQKTFRAEVRKLTAKGIPFALAVYQIVDELTANQLKEDGIDLACQKGCVFCCQQAITCTTAEWIVIRNRLRKATGKPARRLKQRLRKSIPAWRRYATGNPTIDPIRLNRDWLGKTCPFLNDSGTCSVYSIRPIGCRTMTSTIVCTNWKEGGAQDCRYPWERWAHNLILEYEEACQRRMGVTPLLAWIEQEFG